jgi:hypothetical protein
MIIGNAPILNFFALEAVMATTKLMRHTTPLVSDEHLAETPFYPKDEGPWLLAACAETSEAQAGPLEIGYSAKPVNQTIEALAFVRARISTSGDGADGYDVMECRAGGRVGVKERTLVSGFWTSFEAWKPRLVTFNGRGSLIPVLRYASMRHGLTARWIHEAGDRWTGYGARFSPERHIDMMDWLSDLHASPYASLSDVAAALGLPGEGDPAQEDARSRAERRAAIIFLVFIRYELFLGHMSAASHRDAVSSLALVLAAKGEMSSHAAWAATLAASAKEKG